MVSLQNQSTKIFKNAQNSATFDNNSAAEEVDITHLQRNSIRLLINQSGGDETYRLQTAQNINSLETKVKKTFQPSACSIINESQTSGDRAKQAYSIQGGPLSWQVQPSATRGISDLRRTSRVKSSGFTTRCQQVRYVEYVSLLMTGN